MIYIYTYLFEREQSEDFNDFERENYEDFNDIIDLLIGKIFGFVFSRKMGGTIEVFYALTLSFEHRMHVGGAWLMPTSYFQSNFLRSNDLSHPYYHVCACTVARSAFLAI